MSCSPALLDLRASPPSCERFVPSNHTSPSSASSKRTREAANVDLPEPDSPIKAVQERRGMLKLTPSSALRLLLKSPLGPKLLRSSTARSRTSGDACGAVAIAQAPELDA